jgi:hypothetical protein
VWEVKDPKSKIQRPWRQMRPAVVTGGDSRSFCERLQCNDPAAVVVCILDDFYPFPIGYGNRLGAALRRNTVPVTDLTLHLSDLMSLRDVVVAANTNSVTLLMDFTKSSPSLK